MEINNNSSLNASQSTHQRKAVAHTWQVGQLLKAVVLETAQNSVKLRIDNALVQSPTTKQHQRGDVLLLSVVRAGDKPVLKVLPPQLPPAQAIKSLQDGAFKVLLPKQAPLTPLMANLTAITQLKTQIAAPLTAEISDGIKKLLNNITDADKIGDPKALRQAINDSGVLLEKKLANLSLSNDKHHPRTSSDSHTQQTATRTPLNTITQDFKGNLLQLLNSLRQPNTVSNSDSKIPLPLSPANTSVGTINNSKQHRAPTQLTPQVIKENLLRLFNTPPSSSTGETLKASASAPTVRLAEFTAAISRLPLPFFHHQPLQAQKIQLPSLALLQHREQIIDELIRQVEGSLARVQLSQLASLPQEPNTPPSWTFELPLRNGENVDVIQFRIEKEPAQEDDEKEPRWRVTLTLDLPNIGTIYATVSVQGPQASTLLWAENEDTAALINDHLQLLRDALEQHGITASEIKCQCGTPPHPPQQQRHTLLVDTQA